MPIRSKCASTKFIACPDDIRKLGMAVGDFVSLDPKTTITESGYIKSRHLDDKACASDLPGRREGDPGGFWVELDRPTHLYFSVFEEVGHGTSAGIPADVTEVIAVDMAAVGTGPNFG